MRPKGAAWPAPPALVGAALAFALVLFLLLPVVALIASTRPADLQSGLHNAVVVPALSLSLVTTALALAILIVCGTPLGWWLGRSHSRAARWIETALQLPAVIPPTVAGIALLLTFGRRGLLGAWLEVRGLSVAFSLAAVVMAQLFVAAPFYLQAATVAFARIEDEVIGAAQTLGASPAAIFFRVALPLARPGLVAGAAMSWARALGEFGATLMFAGNLAGRTQTLPLAIYTALESDLRAAQALSIILVLVAFALLLVLHRAREGGAMRIVPVGNWRGSP